MSDKFCEDCIYFDYDEIWDGEEEFQYFMCHKGHGDHIGWNVEGCEDYAEEQED